MTFFVPSQTFVLHRIVKGANSTILLTSAISLVLSSLIAYTGCRSLPPCGCYDTTTGLVGKADQPGYGALLSFLGPLSVAFPSSTWTSRLSLPRTKLVRGIFLQDTLNTTIGEIVSVKLQLDKHFLMQRYFQVCLIKLCDLWRRQRCFLNATRGTRRCRVPGKVTRPVTVPALFRCRVCDLLVLCPTGGDDRLFTCPVQSTHSAKEEDWPSAEPPYVRLTWHLELGP